MEEKQGKQGCLYYSGYGYVYAYTIYVMYIRYPRPPSEARTSLPAVYL